MKTYRFYIFCLFLAVFISPAQGQDQTDYLAVFMQGKKVGYAIQNRTESNGKVTTTIDMTITISRVGTPVTVSTKEVCVETSKGLPLSFESVQDMGLMKIIANGVVKPNDKVELTVSSFGGSQVSTIDWPEGAVMAEGLRLLGLKKGLKEGLVYDAKVFSPSLLQAIEVQITIGPKQEIDLLGKVVTGTKTTTVMNLPQAGQIVETSFVDDDLRTLKTVSLIMGMNIEMIACTKEFALGDNDVLELIGKMFLPSPQPLNDLASVSAVTYHLVPTADANDLRIPSTDNQTVAKNKDGTYIVTVSPLTAVSGARFPYKGRDKTIRQAAKPSMYVQSDNKLIIKLARKAIGNTKDASVAVKRIESFVADYIDDKNLSVGYASAVDVAKSKQGDCTEFAVLTAAMCRAVGIPAQVVVGIAYVEEFAGLQNGFGGHAWVHAYVGKNWIGLDAAFKSGNRGGYDAGHIALAYGNGDPVDFFNIVNNMGMFKIDKVSVHKDI